MVSMKAQVQVVKVVSLCLLLPLVYILGLYRSTLPSTTPSTTLSSNTYRADKEATDENSSRRFSMLSGERLAQSRATRWTSDKAFHRYLTSPDVHCRRSYRAGNQGDGGWDVCESPPFLPKQPCLVYSFGIKYDFSFDDAMAGKYNCMVRSYDPSMKRVRSHKRGKNINFIKEGIAGRNHRNKLGWNLFSFATILEKLNDTNRIIDYFKMDVEGAEWETIPDMAARGLFKNIKQIGLEIHRGSDSTAPALLINMLEDNGFRKWKMHYNNVCGYKMKDGTLTSKCIELYFINMDLIDTASLGLFVRKRKI